MLKCCHVARHVLSHRAFFVVLRLRVVHCLTQDPFAVSIRRLTAPKRGARVRANIAMASANDPYSISTSMPDLCHVLSSKCFLSRGLQVPMGTILLAVPPRSLYRYAPYLIYVTKSKPKRLKHKPASAACLETVKLDFMIRLSGSAASLMAQPACRHHFLNQTKP